MIKIEIANPLPLAIHFFWDLHGTHSVVGNTKERHHSKFELDVAEYFYFYFSLIIYQKQKFFSNVDFKNMYYLTYEWRRARGLKILFYVLNNSNWV